MEEIKNTQIKKETKAQTKSPIKVIAKPQAKKEIKVKATIKKAGVSSQKKLVKSKPVKLKTKVKKTKSKKTKIIIKSIAFSLIGIIFLGICSIFVCNDFAMTTLFSNNSNRSFYIVEGVMDNAFNSRYFEMEVNFQYGVIGEEPTSSTKETLQVIHFDDDTYGYTGVAKVSVSEYDFNLYYKEGYLYTNIQVEDSYYKEKQAFSTAQSSFQFLAGIDGNYVFPTENGVLANKLNFETLSTYFIINSNPFYIGECFEFDYGFEKEIYKLDVNGNLRERTYIKYINTFEFILNIKYASINKLLELNYPSDLNTY